MLPLLLLLAAVVVAEILRTELKMGKLDDRITTLETNLDGLVTEVTAAVADIAALKAQIGSGEPVTDEQLATLDAISTRLTDATAALKAGE